MKKIIMAGILLLSVGVPAVASAKPAAKPYKLPASYQAVYCYPTGSYWARQRAAYPDYYAQYGSYYRAAYGSGTMYCPN